MSIQQKALSDSMEQIEQARGLIQKLKLLSTSDQIAIVARRESTIEALAVNAGKIKKPSKKESTKGKVALSLGTA